MNYKLIKDYQESLYNEFTAGKYNRDIDNSKTVYISDEAMYLIGDCVDKVNNDHSILYTKENGQIQLLIEKLKERLIEIIEDNDLSDRRYYIKEAINDMKKYKWEIVTMIKDLIEWLENLQESELTIITTYDKFLRRINNGD